MLKNPQSLVALRDQMIMAANAAEEIMERKNFLKFLKKKIDGAK